MSKKSSLIVYCDNAEIDVEAHYRTVHKSDLPRTPTMSGAELLAYSGADMRRQLFLEGAGQDSEIRQTQAVPVADGMRFYTLPRGIIGG